MISLPLVSGKIIGSNPQFVKNNQAYKQPRFDVVELSDSIVNNYYRGLNIHKKNENILLGLFLKKSFLRISLHHAHPFLFYILFRASLFKNF